VTVAKRLGLSLLLGGMLLLTTGSAGAGGSGSSASGTAHAFAIRVIAPGQQTSESGTVSAPPYHAWFGQGFTYASAVTTGSLTSSATGDAGPTASASASGEVHSLSLFGGEIAAEIVAGRASASTHGRSASGALSGSTVAGLVVLGQSAAVATNARIPLADWGYLITLEESSGTTTGANRIRKFHGFVTALDVHLTAAHGGLPAGSQIQVGYAETTVQGTVPSKEKPAAPPQKHKKAPKSPGSTGRNGAGGGYKGPVLPLPSGLHPQLTAGGYVFPVYGPVSYSDTFGAFRGDVSGNWHHGDDIFAPLGAPILSCAEGTVFSVGWNDVGGNRLWLRDSQGNEFYYAHLSAFSPLAQNGLHVKAGEVLGFVGNTGDAEGTPAHLHFEVHPAALIFMGYDGAVDPTAYLDAWRHLQDVRFQNIAGWVPAEGVTDQAPKPGAILLQVSDISEASGLDPGSLQRAIAARAPSDSDQSLFDALGFRPPANAGTDSRKP
jgi:murein DD-endopeptidase MepM/ murein hydrolase activator NlpD